MPACGRPDLPPVQSISVNAADVKALVAPKPVPSPSIVTDDAASARHSQAIEQWGDGLSRAGRRLCRSFERQAVALGFVCPAAEQ